MSGSRLSKRTRRVGTQRLPRGRAYAALASLLMPLVLGISGCGTDGTSIAGPGAKSQQSAEKITGVVSTPNGMLAANKSWWELPLGLGLSAPAYALSRVSPVGARFPVALVLADPTDALDGNLNSSRPLLPAALTESDGRYNRERPPEPPGQHTSGRRVHGCPRPAGSA